MSSKERDGGLKRKIEGFLSVLAFPSEGAFSAGAGKHFIEGEEHRMETLAFVFLGEEDLTPYRGESLRLPL